MQEIVSFDTVKEMIITVRDQQVILDSDVAKLYGVETKRINEEQWNNQMLYNTPTVMIKKINHIISFLNRWK